MAPQALWRTRLTGHLGLRPGILHAVFERCEYWRLRDASGCPPGVMGWWPSRAVTFLEARPVLGATRSTAFP